MIFYFSSLLLVPFFPELFYFIMMKRHEGKMPTKLGGGKDGWMTEGLGTTRNKTRQDNTHTYGSTNGSTLQP